jgi:hypothetical protein
VWDTLPAQLGLSHKLNLLSQNQLKVEISEG